MDRRAFLLGGTAVTTQNAFSLELAHAVAPAAVAANPGFWASLVEFWSGPGGAALSNAGTVIGTVYSFFSSRDFQSRTHNSLERVEDALQNISRQLNTIIEALKALPGVIEELNENQRRKELLVEIGAYHERNLAAAEAYPNPTEMPWMERAILRQSVVEPQMRAIFEFRSWAKPAHYFAVAYAFSTFVVGARWSGFDRKQFFVVRKRTSAYLLNIAKYFEGLEREDLKTAASNRKTVSLHHGDVLLATVPSRDLGGSPTPPGLFFLRMKGTFETQFSSVRFPSNGSELFGAGDTPAERARLIKSALVNRGGPIAAFNPPIGDIKERIGDLVGQLNDLIFQTKNLELRAPSYGVQAKAARELARYVEAMNY